MVMGSSVHYSVCFPLSSNNNNKKCDPTVLSSTTTATSKMDNEIRVCTNRTCRRQGSMQILEIVKDLSPPNVTVNSCGCLGRCGAGPNLAFLPQGIVISHCANAASAARVIAGQYYPHAVNDDFSIRSVLDTLALRKRAESEIDQSNFSQAHLLLSQAIQIKPFGGLHIMYKYRSIVRLATGDYSGALEDAREALNLAPQYPEGYLCEGDVFMAMELYDAAEKSYSMCLRIDPTIRRSKAFKARVAKLQEKLVAADMPPNQK